MRGRPIFAIALPLLTAHGSAQVMTFTARGEISFAESWTMPGGSSISSPMQTEFALGTPIEMTFSYDVSATEADPGGVFDMYDAPYLVSARIGSRSFSANAVHIQQVDLFPWGGDGYIFQSSSSPPATGLTPVAISEANPFVGSGFSLTSFGMSYLAFEDLTFGAGLPTAWNLDTYDNRFFEFSYSRPANTATNTLQAYASFRGTVSSVTAVPEPTTLAGMGLGLAAVLRRRKKPRLS